MQRFTYFLIALSLFLAPATAAHALSYSNVLNQVGDNAGLAVDGEPNQGLLTMIGSIIAVAMGLLGVVLLLLTIYAGFLWMTAQGNEEQVVKAKTMLRNAVIGLIITLAAYSIASFVVTNVGPSTGGSSSSSGSDASSVWDTDPSN